MPEINKGSSVLLEATVLPLSQGKQAIAFPSWLPECINFYNDSEAQQSGEVKTVFSQKTQELEETRQSIDRNKYSVSPSEIELESVGKNQGSFWVVQEDSQGWLFPKIGGIRQSNWRTLQTLFQIRIEQQSYTYIEVVRPALVTITDGCFWKLIMPGEIVLKDITVEDPSSTASYTVTHAQQCASIVTAAESQQQLVERSTSDLQDLEQQLCLTQKELQVTQEQLQAYIARSNQEKEELLACMRQLSERVKVLEEGSLNSDRQLIQSQTAVASDREQWSLDRLLSVYKQETLENIKQTFASICQEFELISQGKFQVAAKNKGDYWIFPEAEERGWLFPKLPITTAVRKHLEVQLFDCQGTQSDSNRANIIQPARVSLATPDSAEIWKLEAKGSLSWCY